MERKFVAEALCGAITFRFSARLASVIANRCDGFQPPIATPTKIYNKFNRLPYLLPDAALGFGKPTRTP
jgi:hypothetical protein